MQPFSFIMSLIVLKCNSQNRVNSPNIPSPITDPGDVFHLIREMRNPEYCGIVGIKA